MWDEPLTLAFDLPSYPFTFKIYPNRLFFIKVPLHVAGTPLTNSANVRMHYSPSTIFNVFYFHMLILEVG